MTAPLKDLLREREHRLIDLAKAIGVNKATVTRWAQRRIPAERVADVERATGISRHLLRPDLFGEGRMTGT